MLSSLKIENLALVERLNWDLETGLTAITGETGAGKSVIIGALKLLAGERAEKGIIRSGEERALLQGIFHLEKAEEVNHLLEGAGLPLCEDGVLIIRRIMSLKGGKQFINDEACTLGVMKKLSVILMDLHGPHDHQSLFLNEKQQHLLDQYAGLKEPYETYRNAWQKYSAYRAEYEDFMESEMLSPDELELYRFQLEEIQGMNLNAEDVSALEERYQRASNASSLSQSVASLLSVIGDEEGALEKLNELSRVSEEALSLDSSLAETLKPISVASMELQEVELSLRAYLSNLDLDPETFQELEENINNLEMLKRKYGGTIEDVKEHAIRVEKRLQQTEERETTLAQYEAGMKTHQSNLKKLAEKLTKERKKKAPALSEEIRKHLEDLGFKQAQFEVELEPLSELNVRGAEKVEFLFGPNPGEPMKPLKQVASSGEMSRVMLALKSSLAEHDEIPLLVFDEIDANVGGEIATAVGQKMKGLSEARQVLSITHFPQVAAVAPMHCLVKKEMEKGRTVSSLEVLEGEKRTGEIVRMLGAEGEQAEALAKSMLEMK